MNHALIQRNTHAVFSLLRIRAPIDDDQQIELRTKMRRVIELLMEGKAENAHIASLIEWTAVTRALIKPDEYQEALLPTVAAGVAVQNILDRYAVHKVWRANGADLRMLEDWLPWFDELVKTVNKWEINAAAKEADKRIRQAVKGR